MWTRIVLLVAVALASAAAPARAEVLPPIVAPLEALAEQARVTAVALAADAAVAHARAVARQAAQRRRRALIRLRRSKTVAGALKRAYLHGVLSVEAYELLRAEDATARRTLRALSGTPRAELAAVIGFLDGLAARRQLTTTRLPVAFTLLRENVRHWSGGTVPDPRSRKTVDDGAIVLQYYPGAGLQFQPLASWGQANGLAKRCLASVRVGRRCRADELRRIVSRLLSLGSRRSGYLAWEHLFAWGGGSTPWVSGMTQATAIQTLSRTAAALGDERFAAAARDALGAFEQPPPAGVAVPERDGGTHYLMYSFSPGLRIFNGGLQAVSGLRDAATLLRSRRALNLFRAGDRAARRAVEAADTGAWSRYSLGGRESTLSYHQLTREFLGRLCDSTEQTTYCAAEQRFARYEREPVFLRLDPLRRLHARRRVLLRFWVSKISTVTLTVSSGLRASFQLPRGEHTYPWTPPRRGRYTIRMTARGLSGPPGNLARQVRVVLPKPKPRRRSCAAQRKRSLSNGRTRAAAPGPSSPGGRTKRCRPRSRTAG